MVMLVLKHLYFHQYFSSAQFNYTEATLEISLLISNARRSTRKIFVNYYTAWIQKVH